MSVRVTKPCRWCKVATGAMALWVISASPANTAPDSLRGCVIQARDAAAVALCEQRGQAALKKSIRRLSAAIRNRLDGGQRPVFDRSATAWQAFLDQESALLKLSLDLRQDGLGPKLLQGGVTRLYEQREQQLREHLHNLSQAQTTEAPAEQ